MDALSSGGQELEIGGNAMLHAFVRFFSFALLLALTLSVLTACGGGGGSVSGTSSSVNGSTGVSAATSDREDIRGDTISVSAWVSPEKGGTLTLPNGAVLNIPPGAVSAPVNITFSTAAEADDQEPGRCFSIEPSMRLNRNATLTVPYSEVVGEDPASLIDVVSSSRLNEELSSSGEVTTWQELTPLSMSETNDTVTFELDHFSLAFVVNRVDDPAYLVFELPSQFLLPGDFLVTLTASAPLLNIEHLRRYNWIPGHCAIYVEKDRLQGKTVMAPDGPNKQKVVAGEPDCVEAVSAGVSPASVRTFMGGFEFDHIYLGARRPRYPYSNSQREAVVG